MDNADAEKPNLRVHYSNTVAAEKWALSQGVDADYANQLDIADWCSELLVQLVERRLPLPDKIEVDASVFRSLYGRKAFAIPASSEQAAIRINPASFVWQDIVGNTNLLYNQRQWSTNHPLHLLFHEAGHIVHHKINPTSYESLRLTDLTPNEKTFVEGRVSSYARESPYEFLSEVFAALMAGKALQSFGKRIAARYRVWGGIEP